MTRLQFIQLVRDDLKRQYYQLGLFMGLFLVFALVGGLLVKRGGDQILRLNSPQLWLLAVLTAVVLIVSMAGLRVIGKALLRCPHCRKLLGGFSAQVVVGSGRCGFCGEQIIDRSEKG